MTNVTITPHSPDPSAVEATIDTLRMLHGAGFEHTETRDGKIYGTSSNAGYLKWAAERQGYCVLVEVEGAPPSVMQVLAEQARGKADVDGRGWCRQLAETPKRTQGPRPIGLNRELADLVLRPRHMRQSED